jgi:hypothetical protein
VEGTTERAGLRQPIADEAVGTLRALVRRQELFARRVTEPHLSPSALAAGSASWFGVGVSGENASRGLPIDVLVLVYAQELVRRSLGWERSYVLVADLDAITPNIPSLAVRRATDRALDRLSSVVARLGFPVGLLTASELARAETTRIAAAIRSDNPYVRQQLAQTEVMRRRGVTAKIGWALSSVTLDETFFDGIYRQLHGNKVSFLYAIGGRTLDPRRPRACPYLCDDPDRRILLEPGEDVVQKLASARPSSARGYRRLLDKLARAHARLTGDPAASGVELAQSLVDSL